MASELEVSAFEVQSTPKIIVASIAGSWLLKRSTPSWRIEDPVKGFQRVVREDRARQIAVSVIDQGRTFPNAIVLATSLGSLRVLDGRLVLPNAIRFLVVDGQHRLWAQNFSSNKIDYACVIHTGLSKVEMARLFLEINDNQKRVPSSLRWDLVRLVRPDDDPVAIETSELVYELATDERSALYQRIDLTGEQGQIEIKQGSIAPEIKSLVSSRRETMKGLDFETRFEGLIKFFAAVQATDAQGWRSGSSELSKPRVIRALIRLIPEISQDLRLPPHKISIQKYAGYIQKIDKSSLETEQIRAIQGSAGIKEIFETLKLQVGLT